MKPQLGLFSYVIGIDPGDAENRLAFCQFLSGLIEADPGIMDRILWTDESTYGRIGMFNQHNEHYWAHENPNVVREGKYF